MAVALAVAGAVLARRLRRVVVAGESMLPTLEPGDRLLVVLGLRPRPGDLVAFADPRWAGRLVVKRVASVRGDRVAVLGDNPGASTDSRTFGPVARASVLGRVVYRYWPEGRRGRLVRSVRSEAVERLQRLDRAK